MHGVTIILLLFFQLTCNYPSASAGYQFLHVLVYVSSISVGHRMAVAKLGILSIPHLFSLFKYFVAAAPLNSRLWQILKKSSSLSVRQNRRTLQWSRLCFHARGHHRLPTSSPSSSSITGSIYIHCILKPDDVHHYLTCWSHGYPEISKCVCV